MLTYDACEENQLEFFLDQSQLLQPFSFKLTSNLWATREVCIFKHFASFGSQTTRPNQRGCHSPVQDIVRLTRLTLTMQNTSCGRSQSSAVQAVGNQSVSSMPWPQFGSPGGGGPKLVDVWMEDEVSIHGINSRLRYQS